MRQFIYPNTWFSDISDVDAVQGRNYELQCSDNDPSYGVQAPDVIEQGPDVLEQTCTKFPPILLGQATSLSWAVFDKVTEEVDKVY